jgi:two-component system, chemotaxis family, chemotaxis protein CheY
MRDILIVDPDESIRTMLCIMFTAVGYTADEAETGEDGLRLALAAPPRVVLTELHLPGMDGLTFARLLRQLPFLPTPQLFLMSTHVPLHLSDVGQRATFAKPLDLEELLAQVALVAPPSEKHPGLRERWAG